MRFNPLTETNFERYKCKNYCPKEFKITGLCPVSCTIVLSVVYFVYGFQITMPVIAVFTSYINVAVELILLLFIPGFFMFSYAKEKDERQCLRAVRIKAVNQSIFIYTFWLIFSVMFVFGKGFLSILVLNIVLPFVIYLILFYTKKNKTLIKRLLHQFQNRILKPRADLKKE